MDKKMQNPNKIIGKTRLEIIECINKQQVPSAVIKLILQNICCQMEIAELQGVLNSREEEKSEQEG